MEAYFSPLISWTFYSVPLPLNIVVQRLTLNKELGKFKMKPSSSMLIQ